MRIDHLAKPLQAGLVAGEQPQREPGLLHSELAPPPREMHFTAHIVVLRLHLAAKWKHNRAITRAGSAVGRYPAC